VSSTDLQAIRDARRAGAPTGYPAAYRLLAGVVGAAGLFVVLVAARDLFRIPWNYLLLFGTMSAFSSVIIFRLPTGISFNPQSAIALAALYLFGWKVPVLLTVLSLAIFWLRVQRPFWRASFDLGNIVLSVMAASTIAPVGLTPITGDIAARFFAAGIAYALVNTLFTLFGRAVETGDRMFLTLDTLIRTFLLSVSMTPVGFIIAILFGEFGDVGALLGFTSWLLASVALKGNYEAREAQGRLAETNRKLEEALVAVERLSITDPLTGLYNRRHFRIRLEEEFKREARDATPFSLLLFDLVGFKAVNDTHGHLIGDVVLQPGDTLLLEAHPSFVDQQRNSRDFFLVSRLEGSRPPRHEKAYVSLAILGAMVALAAMGWLSMLEAGMLAAGAMLITRCVTGAEARDSVEWSVLIVIAAALGLGAAIEKTGLASAVAGTLIRAAGNNPWLALAAIYGVTMVFTELLTNNAAAALMFPFAVATATDLQANPVPFVMIVMVAASCGFATPIGYQTNTMVYGVGGYRFLDYTRVGGPLNLILMVVTTLAIAWLWGL